MLTAPYAMKRKPYTEKATPTAATALLGLGSLPAHSVMDPNAQASMHFMAQELYAKLPKALHPCITPNGSRIVGQSICYSSYRQPPQSSICIMECHGTHDAYR